MAASAHVSYPADGVGLVLIDNPPMNFGTWELMNRVEEAVTAVKEAGSRVVVLASDVPGYFIAHAHLGDIVEAMTGGTPSGDGRSWFTLLNELRYGPMVSIAVNNGQAWGGGAELSWHCNLRIAGESAHYGQPESILGIIPGAGGTTTLPRVIGECKALELILDGQPLAARDALAMGAINRVVPDDRLRAEAIAWAARIATRPAWALEACKRSLVEGAELPLREARRNEGRIFAEVAVRPEAIDIMREAQGRYDAGQDSFAALGVERPG